MTLTVFRDGAWGPVVLVGFFDVELAAKTTSSSSYPARNTSTRGVFRSDSHAALISENLLLRRKIRMKDSESFFNLRNKRDFLKIIAQENTEKASRVIITNLTIRFDARISLNKSISLPCASRFSNGFVRFNNHLQFNLLRDDSTQTSNKRASYHISPCPSIRLVLLFSRQKPAQSVFSQFSAGL
jgi:hypothetical protein